MTYLFLRYVLFKPVIKIILHEENLVTQAHYEIAQQEAHIAEQFHLRQLNWQEFKTHCQFNKPTIEDPISLPETSSFVLPKMSENSSYMKTMSAKCAMLIVNHLKHEDLS
jgi:hypothetical protein